MDAINKRVVQFLQQTGKTKSEFANQLGISPAVLSHISNGRNKVGLDLVQKITLHYPSLSIQWLVSGIGEMFETENKANMALIAQEMKSLKKELNEMSNRLTVYKRNFDHVMRLLEG
ncbi:MAG: helix-turn-helix transcriptional regulator [Bacteroidetes bacterium]|jgi:plasmid maintenance system antidote protein VapI|nr:helix-turn-helix transcriptional regulator [Bacteroidota bacterium]